MLSRENRTEPYLFNSDPSFFFHRRPRHIFCHAPTCPQSPDAPTTLGSSYVFWMRPALSQSLLHFHPSPPSQHIPPDCTSSFYLFRHLPPPSPLLSPLWRPGTLYYCGTIACLGVATTPHAGEQLWSTWLACAYMSGASKLSVSFSRAAIRLARQRVACVVRDSDCTVTKALDA